MFIPLLPTKKSLMLRCALGLCAERLRASLRRAARRQGTGGRRKSHMEILWINGSFITCFKRINYQSMGIPGS
jgi:hypothetical protein